MKKYDAKLVRRINEEALSRKESFSTASLVGKLESEFPSFSKDFLSDCVEQTLSLNDDIFVSYGEHMGISHFSPKAVFMKGAEFCSTPSGTEIRKGFFVPGDVFSVFIPEGKDIQKVKLLYLNKGIELKSCPKKLSLAEFKSKFPFSSAISPKGKNTEISAFEMKDFYSKTGFEDGDTILFRVEDYDNMILSFRRKSAVERRDTRAIKKWCQKMENSMVKILEELGDFVGFREQIEEIFLSEPDLLKNPPISFEEFLKASNSVSLVKHDGKNILWSNRVDQDESADAVDEGMISISKGATGLMGDILEDIGLTILPDLIDSYIRDALFSRLSLSSVNERLTAFAANPFADEAQRISFEMMMEDRWEQISESYQFNVDSVKGVFRRKLLDIYDSILSFVLDIEKKGILLSNVPEGDFKKFSFFLANLSDTIISLDEDGSEMNKDKIDKIEEIFKSFEEIRKFTEEFEKV